MTNSTLFFPKMLTQLRLVGVFGLALFAQLFFTAQASAQLPMTRSSFSGTYNAISIAGGATASTASGDDGVETSVPIGFTFNYLGTPYTNIAICTNGWISFNATTTSGSWSNADMYTTSGPNNAVFPWFDDLTTSVNSVTGGTPSILYQVQGTPGSQTLTVQWTDFCAYRTAGGSAINFQVILYEGTDIIEFRYGTMVLGTPLTGTSASIGIENNTGGPGNYLDVMTGSSRCGHFYLDESQWPTRFFRLTPGAPTVLAGNTYSVGVGQTYHNLTDAISDINQRGISGAVTLNLTDAAYDGTIANGGNMFPLLFGPVVGTSATNTITLTSAGPRPVISWGGPNFNASGSTVNGTTTITNTSLEPIIGLVGTDYVTLSNLDIRGNVGSQFADYGIGIFNNTATDGANFNTVSDVFITMSRAITGSRGIFMNTSVTPTAATGANSNNTFRDLVIKNAYAGIQLTGNATNPDLNTVIGTSSCTAFNTIGDPLTPNDLGNGTTQTYGIRATNQSGFSISNNRVNNVTNTAGIADGILIETFQGTSSLNNNIIQNIRNAGPTSTSTVTGIRMTHTTTGTHTLRVYNNVVSQITSGYTGAATATRAIKGINISGTGGTTTVAYQIFNNSVSIDGSGSPTISSVCYEHATTSGPVFTVANNIFANFTAAQTGLARHSVMHTTSATLFGNTGSTSNNNDLFILNDQGTSGFIGIGNTTTYATLANWQTAVSQDAASLTVNPNFINNATNLKVTNLALNGAGQAYPAYVTQDLDCAARIPDNDLGAYVINGCIGLPTAGTINGAASVCSGTATNLTLTGASTDAGISYQWASSTTPGGPYTPFGAGALNQSTGTLTVPTYYVVTVTCSASGLSATTAEKSVMIDALPNVAVSPSSASICTPNSISLTASGASGYTWSPGSSLSATTGTSVTATPPASTVYTVVGTAANGCTASASSSITVTATPLITSITATIPAVCPGGNSQLNVNANVKSILITEVTLFRTGTGATSPYPAFAPGADLVEITNISTNATDVSGYTISAFASNGTTPSHTFTFPGGTVIPAGGVLVVHLGTGTDDLVNRYFNTTGANDSYSSNSLVGIVVYNGSVVVDAVGCGSGYVFNAATSVTPSDFSGFAPSASGLAGTIRTAASDNNVGGDWSPSSASLLQTIGTYNSGYATTSPITSYTWSPGTFLSSTSVSNPMVNAITATTSYTVSVEASGCIATANFTITATGVSLSTTSNNVSCNGGNNGSINLTVSSGTAPYSFSWSNGATTQNLSGLVANSYTVTVVDNNGCSNTTSVVITQPTALGTSISSSSNVSCNAGNNGSATAAVTGGSAPYSYMWSNGATTQTATGLMAGVYVVTITDAGTCSNTASVTITEPAGMTLTANGTSPSCNGGTNGSIDLTVSGGAAPYSFMWSNGATTEDIAGIPAGNYSVTVTDANTCSSNSSTSLSAPSAVVATIGAATNVRCNGSNDGTAPVTASGGTGPYTFIWSNGSTDQNQTGLAAGTYTVTATDALGCASAPASVTITQPSAINASATGSNVSCNGGSDGAVNATVSGGTAPYSFMWSNGATTQNLAALMAGTYAATVTDANTCTATITAVTITQPSVIVGSATGTNISCNGGNNGAINLSVTGGNAPYTFMWSNGATTQNLAALTVGSYAVTITDASGCSSAVAATNITEPAAIAITNVVGNETSVGANDGSIDATVTGGVSPYTYFWSNGATSQDLTGLAGGTYVVTVTDANNCVMTSSVTVSTIVAVNVVSKDNIRLMPNPTTGSAFLQIEMNEEKEVRIDLFGLNGQLLQQLQPQFGTNQIHHIDLSSYPAGTYMLRVVIGNEVSTHRVVLTR